MAAQAHGTYNDYTDLVEDALGQIKSADSPIGADNIRPLELAIHRLQQALEITRSEEFDGEPEEIIELAE